MGIWMLKEDSLANCHLAVKCISWNRNWTWMPPPPPFPPPHPSLSPSLYQRLRGLFFFFFLLLSVHPVHSALYPFLCFQVKRDRTFTFVFRFLGLNNQARIQDGKQTFTLTPLSRTRLKWLGSSSSSSSESWWSRCQEAAPPGGRGRNCCLGLSWLLGVACRAWTFWGTVSEPLQYQPSRPRNHHTRHYSRNLWPALIQ